MNILLEQEALKNDYCDIAHKLLANDEVAQGLEENGLSESDTETDDAEENLDQTDQKVIELMKSIEQVNEVFEDVVSWSRLTATCSAVLLNENAPEEDSSFAEKKNQELQVKAEELKSKLENATKLIEAITAECPHLDNLQELSKKIDMFLSYTKDLEKQSEESSIAPSYLQEINVLSNQLEKQLHAANLLEHSALEDALNGVSEAEESSEENIYKKLASFDKWIDRKQDELNACGSHGGLPETAQEQLDKHLVLLKEIEEKENEIEEFLSSNDIDNPALESKLNALKAAADSRKEKLLETLKEATTFHGNLQGFMSWLVEAERKLKSINKSPISVLPEKISKQIADHNAFEESFKERRLELLELDKMGSHLKYFAQKQDGTLIKNLLLSVHSRWDKLLAGLASYSQAINELSKKSKQFSETSTELMDWISSATSKLDSSIPRHIEDDQSAQIEVNVYEEFQKALTSKQPVYNAVMRSGTVLHDKATLFNDKAEIDKILNQLKQQWTALKQKSIQRKQQLEDSLKFSESLSDSINSIMDWLFAVEPQLCDVQVHGDINTVDTLMNQHNIVKNEMEEHNATVESLQEALRNEQGEDWKSDHLQDLLKKWNAVSKQADIKQEMLDDAEKQAVDLHSSAEKLLSHLSKVESDLHSNSKLPQDDFQLQELKLSHQATLADLTEKEPEFTRVVELANYILDRAHPDAVIPIRQLIKVLQSKWFEVQVKANDHTAQIEETIAELEGDFKLIDKLKKWLSSTEHQLKEQNEQPIELENIENLTKQLQAFQDEMTAQQPDYDKLVGRYATRKTQQPVSKKSPRGKASKKDDDADSGVRLQCEKLQTQWNSVWLMTLERQKKLQEAATSSTKEPKPAKSDGFDFEKWRKKFMRWLKSRKLKPMEFFRAMDKDLDGTITRQEFMDGLQHSNMPIKESEIKKVCDYFEQESGDSVDYYKLVAALYPAKDMMKHAKEADQIENEVVRQVAKCTCCKRFNVQQIAENKYRFGDNQQLRLVRILKSTVMVRVGGGWMALDEFLVKNDPCRAKKRTNTELREKFLLPAGASQSMSPFRSKKSPGRSRPTTS